ncbi:hypothetical protein B0J15DRAFT_509199 [Fusarium solani]|uniref:Xylanolytic transcriptional activator regulatory domain-containing protein n=1 Tax=Fusarium solani TaxID=169388 RepID=A0A9P9L3E1_FUSSL|nr:uncharacterized protein B0J15DRAFT_509199 [Fusarium solani]KAH7273214.1 hypothetical protein B0J15DRAFT_509199 [Fusarium solani]
MAKRAWADTKMGDAGTGASGGVVMLPTPAALTPSKSEDQSEASNHQNPNDLSSFRNDGVPFPSISRKIKACATCRKLKDLEQVHGALKRVLQGLGLRELPPLQCLAAARKTEGSLLGDKPRNASSHQPPSLPEDYCGPSCDNSPMTTPEDEGLPYVPIHSLYTLTKLSALRSPEDNEAGQRARTIDDFIARGSIALVDAESLFTLYRDRLDRYIYSIGCCYQSLEELRRKSPILSAAILTVAALHDPKADGIYGVCCSEFRRLMEKSMFERLINRDYLRAMCVASYWLSDISWMLSGYAIRRAAELRNSYRQAINACRQEAADYARLWYVLYICDQHLATLYGRPSIIQEDSSDQGWGYFLGPGVATDEDKRLIGQVALMGILRGIQELFGDNKDEAIPQEHISHISHFRRQLDQWYDQWTKELPEYWPQLGSFPLKGTTLHYNFAQIHLYSHIFRGLSGDDPIPAYFFDYALNAIAAATAVVELIIADPDVAKGIAGMPSYMHSMTAFASMLLIKAAIKHGGKLVETERVCGLITRLIRQFRSQPVGRWHLANLMAGGLERMLEMLNTAEPRQGHPLPNGLVAGAGTSDGINERGQMLDADGLFPDLHGGLFFDYDMSVGLSHVFQLDPEMLNIEGSALPL